MRGKEASRKLRGTLKGITPAYAGKRAKRGRLAAGRWDHPRVCGEKALIHGITFPSLGLPPRMRGKAHALKKRPLPVGITPAYAGKSSFLSGCTRMPRDHPRVCGEKRPRHAGMHAQKGSPPRMRGKVTWCCSFLDGNRITPAYAGKRSHFLLLIAVYCGSPPRMRGKVSQFVNLFRGDGITPAYAGKSCIPVP